MAKERVKAKLQKELFLTRLEEMPVTSVVCKKIGVSRASIYRWRDKDPEFDAKVIEAKIKGDDNMRDLAEYQVLKKMQEGDLSAAKYYLDRKHPAYARRTSIPDTARQPNLFQLIISKVGNKGKKAAEHKNEK
ncbi:MAG: hypothetical protein WCQ96_01465 [Patescibacteria group bacterium]